MKFEIIKIAPFKYLLHYAHGVSSKKLPDGLNINHDLFIDFSPLIDSNGKTIAAQQLLHDFCLLINREKIKSAKLLEFLPFGKRFSINNAASIFIAINMVRMHGLLVLSIPAVKEFYSSKPNKLSERSYEKAHFSDLRVLCLERSSEQSIVESDKCFADLSFFSIKKVHFPDALSPRVHKQYQVDLRLITPESSLDGRVILNAHEVAILIFNNVIPEEALIKPRLEEDPLLAKDFMQVFSSLSKEDKALYFKCSSSKGSESLLPHVQAMLLDEEVRDKIIMQVEEQVSDSMTLKSY